MQEDFPDAALTKITRDETGEIVQLDVFYPEIDEAEVVYRVNILEFSKAYPLRGGYRVEQIYDKQRWGDYTASIRELYFENDCIRTSDDSIDPHGSEDVALRIRQHIGDMDNYSVAVGATTMDPYRTYCQAQSTLMGLMLEDMISGNNCTVN